MPGLVPGILRFGSPGHSGASECDDVTRRRTSATPIRVAGNLDLFSAKLSEIPGSRPASAGRAPE